MTCTMQAGHGDPFCAKLVLSVLSILLWASLQLLLCQKLHAVTGINLESCAVPLSLAVGVALSAFQRKLGLELWVTCYTTARMHLHPLQDQLECSSLACYDSFSCLQYRQSESVLAVDIAQAFLPPDALLVDIVTNMLAQTPATKAADPELRPLLEPDSAINIEPPALQSTCALPPLPKHFVGRDDAVAQLASFLESPVSVCMLLHGGPGQVTDVIINSGECETAVTW